MSNGRIVVKNNSRYVSISLNVLCSALGVVIPFVLYDAAVSVQGDQRLFIEGIFFWYLGALFLLSYKYQNQVSLLYAINLICRKWAVFGRDYRAAIYASMFWVAAAWKHLQWIFADQS